MILLFRKREPIIQKTFNQDVILHYSWLTKSVFKFDFKERFFIKFLNKKGNTGVYFWYDELENDEFESDKFTYQ